MTDDVRRARDRNTGTNEPHRCPEECHHPSGPAHSAAKHHDAHKVSGPPEPSDRAREDASTPRTWHPAHTASSRRRGEGRPTRRRSSTSIDRATSRTDNAEPNTPQTTYPRARSHRCCHRRPHPHPRWWPRHATCERGRLPGHPDETPGLPTQHAKTSQGEPQTVEREVVTSSA